MKEYEYDHHWNVGKVVGWPGIEPEIPGGGTSWPQSTWPMLYMWLRVINYVIKTEGSFI